MTPLSFEAPSPSNPSGYLHSAYFTRNYDPWATFLSWIVWVYLHSYFYGGLRNVAKCIIAVQGPFQGHPRLLILVPIESTYTTSY